jgi:hypothetical protein
MDLAFLPIIGAKRERWKEEHLRIREFFSDFQVR